MKRLIWASLLALAACADPEPPKLRPQCTPNETLAENPHAYDGCLADPAAREAVREEMFRREAAEQKRIRQKQRAP